MTKYKDTPLPWLVRKPRKWPTMPKILFRHDQTQRLSADIEKIVSIQFDEFVKDFMNKNPNLRTPTMSETPASFTAPHKHADVIKAWADGADIECRNPGVENDPWCPIGKMPSWFEDYEYRVKPKSKIVRWQWITVFMSKFPRLSRCFYSESEAINAFNIGVQVIGKAEWTRMEFDE